MRVPRRARRTKGIPRAAQAIGDLIVPSLLVSRNRRLGRCAITPTSATAVAELCSRFPGEYWRGLEPDGYPEEFVAALTAGGWLASSFPTEYGGAGLGLDRGERRPRGDQRVGRQRRRVPRADVHDGDDPAARLDRAEAALAAADRRGYAPAAGVRRDRADRRERHDADRDDRRANEPTATSCAARRSGRRARCTPT